MVTKSSLIARLKGELPPTAPIPGVLQTVLTSRWPLEYLEFCRDRYGSRFTLYPADMPPLVFLCSAPDIRAILTAPASVLHPGEGGAAITPIVGESSFMLSEEDEHLAGRRATLPPFHRRAVNAHADAVAAIARDELATWPVDKPFAVHPYLLELTLKVIVRTVFGGEDSILAELRTHLLRMLSVTARPVLQEPRLRALPVWRTIWRRFEVERRRTDELFYALIAQRRLECAQDADVLDMLLHAHNPDGSAMSDQQVRNNLMSVILAGHETTASELAWAFQLLAHNRRVQERLIEDIESGREEYLTATVQEVLRHRPVFLFAIPRAVIQPITVGGWTYRAPAHLVGCVYLMHHDPAVYPDPNQFRPERFMGSTPHPQLWLPWGGGRKYCPGRHLATLEMRTVLRTVLETRAVLPVTERIEHPRWRSVIVTPHRGSLVRLCERRCSASNGDNGCSRGTIAGQTKAMVALPSRGCVL